MTAFAQIAPRLRADLMKTFGLTKAQAAGIIGNLSHESGGFTQIYEIGHPDRGIGWAQWTGPRHRQFVAYCQRNKLSARDYEANWGFLCKELQGAYAGCINAVKKTKTVAQATVVFEQCYERAGVVHMDSRLRWAKESLTA